MRAPFQPRDCRTAVRRVAAIARRSRQRRPKQGVWGANRLFVPCEPSAEEAANQQGHFVRSGTEAPAGGSEISTNVGAKCTQTSGHVKPRFVSHPAGHGGPRRIGCSQGATEKVLKSRSQACRTQSCVG